MEMNKLYRSSSIENKVWIKPKPAVLKPEAANTTSGKSIARDPSAVVTPSNVSVNPSKRESMRLKRMAAFESRTAIAAPKHGRTRKGPHAVWLNTHHSPEVPESFHNSTTVKQQEDQVETRTTNAVWVKPAAKEPCLFFNKSGKCRNGAKCPFLHDPRLVNVCNGFLRGVCLDKECPLR